jgi:preprotein translocase subunit Sss1
VERSRRGVRLLGIFGLGLVVWTCVALAAIGLVGWLLYLFLTLLRGLS